MCFKGIFALEDGIFLPVAECTDVECLILPDPHWELEKQERVLQGSWKLELKIKVLRQGRQVRVSGSLLCYPIIGSQQFDLLRDLRTDSTYISTFGLCLPAPC